MCCGYNAFSLLLYKIIYLEMYVIYYYQVLGEYGKVNLRSLEELQQQVRKLATSIIISSQHDNNMYPFSKLELLC